MCKASGLNNGIEIAKEVNSYKNTDKSGTFATYYLTG